MGNHLPSEYLTEVHDQFVNGIGNLLVGVSSKDHSFSIEQTCLEGRNSATVPFGSEQIHFDILIVEETGNRRIHYCVECKTRRDSDSQTASELKQHLKEFIKKAYKTIDHLEGRYDERVRADYGFIFISDVPFGVWNTDIDFDFLKEALVDLGTLDNCKITKLTSKLKVMVFADWFIDLFKEE